MTPVPRIGMLCAAFFGLWFTTATWAEVAVPPLKARVTDLTGTLDIGQRATLEAELEAVEAHDGSQVAVLLVPTTRPEAIEQYAMRVVENWKLGRKGKDNGVLLLVAKDDRKVRIEVGYGLEGTIPDVIAKRIIDEAITPRFKQGDFGGGVDAGVQRIAALIAGRPAAREPDKSRTPDTPTIEDRDIPKPSHSGSIMDLTDSLSDEQNVALIKSLDDFYRSGRTKPAFVLVVHSTKPEPIAQYAARVLKDWGQTDNLDIDRSLLLVVAKDQGEAWIEAGAGLHRRILPGAVERALAEVIEPRLRKGETAAAIVDGVREIENIIDGAVNNKTFSERLSETVLELPIWLLVLLAALGTALRWLLGPLFGATATASLVGTGAWLASEGDMGTVIPAAVVAFIFVLVGLANWIAMGLDGIVSEGGGGGGSGGFSGGGGSFGGGGASGSW